VSKNEKASISISKTLGNFLAWQFIGKISPQSFILSMGSVGWLK
jgi:hypothetical protein